MKPWQLTDEERMATHMMPDELMQLAKDQFGPHFIQFEIWAGTVADRAADAAGRKAALWAAGIAADKWPRGSAHTYASENGDRYVALEDASEAIAKDIRKELK